MSKKHYMDLSCFGENGKRMGKIKNHKLFKLWILKISKKLKNKKRDRCPSRSNFKLS